MNKRSSGSVIKLPVTDALLKCKVFANVIALCKLYRDSLKQFLPPSKRKSVLQAYHICTTFVFEIFTVLSHISMGPIICVTTLSCLTAHDELHKVFIVTRGHKKNGL